MLLLFVIYKFIILERKSPNDAFLLGFCIYGIFDFTNIASVIKNEYFEPNNKSLNFNNIFLN